MPPAIILKLNLVQVNLKVILNILMMKKAIKRIMIKENSKFESRHREY